MLDLSDNRNAVVSGQGEMEYIIDDEDCDDIFEDIREYLSNDDYYTAATEFMDTIAYYIDEDEDEEYNEDKPMSYYDYDEEYDEDSDIYSNINEYTIGRIVHALLALLITLFIMWFIISRSGGKITVNRSTYLDDYRSRVVAKEDRYIRTKRTKRRISNDTAHSHHSSSLFLFLFIIFAIFTVGNITGSIFADAV